MNKLKFEFTQEEINYIASCVAQRPLAECEELMNNIRQQASPQEAEQLEVVEE